MESSDVDADILNFTIGSSVSNSSRSSYYTSNSDTSGSNDKIIDIRLIDRMDIEEALEKETAAMSTCSFLGVKKRTTRRDENDILSIGISVSKEEREDLKTNDKKTYYKVRESCTKGIVNKFTQLKAIDENSPIEYFESVYLVVTHFDDLQESLRVNDMIGFFAIASSYERDGTGPSAGVTSIDLFHNIKTADMEMIKLANQYFMEYGID